MDGTPGSGPTHHRLKAWLALARAPALSPPTFLELRTAGVDLLEHVGARWLPPGLPLSPALRSQLVAPDWTGVERDLDWLRRDVNHLVTIDDPAYPPLLREIPDPPLVLYVRGDPGALCASQLAIVGSRNPTEGGRRTARGAG